MAWIEEVLARAGGAPITLVISSFTFELGPNNKIAQRDVLDKFSNLTELIIFRHPRFTPILRVYRSQDVQWEDLLQSLVRPAPHLETLALVVVDEERADLSYLEHHLLPKTLLNGQAPCLRTLDLNGCTFSLSWPVLQNLTELRVSSVKRVDAVPVQEWLALLSNLSALEILALRYAILEGGGTPQGEIFYSEGDVATSQTPQTCCGQ